GHPVACGRPAVGGRLAACPAADYRRVHVDRRDRRRRPGLHPRDDALRALVPDEWHRGMTTATAAADAPVARPSGHQPAVGTAPGAALRPLVGADRATGAGA